MKQKNILIIGGLIIVIIAFVLIRKNDNGSAVTGDLASSTPLSITGSSTGSQNNKPAIKPQPAYTIKRLPDIVYKKPDLTVPLVVSSKVAPEVKVVITTKFDAVRNELQKNPANYENWLEYGLYKKLAEDYKGAEAAWLYAETMPHNYVVYENLADLYAYYLHDNTSAEINFRQAINSAKDHVELYRNFYSFYADVLHDTVKAQAILNEGIAANPDKSADLKVLLTK